MNDIHDPKHPVILFIPETGIYPFMRALAVLGDAVQKRGGSVLVTHDPGVLPRTSAMSAHPVHLSPQEKAEIIASNGRAFKEVLRVYGFGGIELADFIDDRLMTEIEHLTEVPDAELENISFRGLAVGKIALHDYILATKAPYGKQSSRDDKALYEAYIKSTAITVALVDRICKQLKPSLLITFNEYSQCQAARYSAEVNGVPRMGVTYPVHFGVDTSRFCIGKSVLIYPSFLHYQEWQKVKDIPVSPRYIQECWQDVLHRAFASGSHIHSLRKELDPGTIFGKLKLDPRKKTIVAYTSSSDERFGMDVLIKIWNDERPILDAFPDQIAWLKWLRDQARTRSDIQVVVRVHPREGSRRFGFESEHLKTLKKEFAEPTADFIMVWPDDPISSYDVMELADVCLISWSTIGQEAARLGVPVLTCSGNMFYPDDDFIQTATNLDEYEKKFNAILKMDYTWNHLVKGVRLYHWRTFIPSLDLSETVPRGFKDESIWPEAPADKIDAINDILSGKDDLVAYTTKQWKKGLTADAATEESEAVRYGIRLFLDRVYYPPIFLEKKLGATIFRFYRRSLKALSLIFGKKLYLKLFRESFVWPFKDYSLEFVPTIGNLETLRQKTTQHRNLRIIAADGSYAILIHKGRLLRRMSPLIIRLAKLYAGSLQ